MEGECSISSLPQWGAFSHLSNNGASSNHSNQMSVTKSSSWDLIQWPCSFWCLCVLVCVCACVRVDGAVGQLLNSARLEDHSGCPCWLCPQQKMTNGSMSRVFDHNYREREKEKKTRREGQRERDRERETERERQRDRG